MARPEITGRKVKASPEGPLIPLAAYSIAQFCAAHDLSEAMYFKLKAQGLGPDEMEVGRRRMISVEAAARWRSGREVAARGSLQESAET